MNEFNRPERNVNLQSRSSAAPRQAHLITNIDDCVLNDSQSTV